MGTTNDVAMDLLEVLKQKLVTPMASDNECVEAVIGFMKNYNLSRDDWDTLATQGEFGRKALKIPTKTKSAFTRKCTKELSNVAAKVPKGKKGKKEKDDGMLKMTEEGEGEDGGGGESSEEEDEGVAGDSRIKMKKGKATAKGKGKKKAAKKTTKRKRKK